MASQTTTVHSNPLRPAIHLALLFAVLKLGIHLAASLWQSHIGYGYFRDEFYYIACGRHLASGYVDHGPIVALQARASELLFGHSLAGLRFLSSVGGALRVALTGILAWSLGGRRPAQALAMLAVLTTPMYLGQDGYLSMNSWESAFWLPCFLAIVQIAKTTSSPRTGWTWWTVFGISAGIGLLNKPSMAFFLLALGAGLLLIRLYGQEQYRLLLTRQAAYSIALLALIASPNLFWQLHNHWPTLEFLHNGRVQNKNVHLAPLAFLANQVFTLGPWTAFVWLPGLVRSLRKRELRWIGLTFVLFLSAMIALGAKDYYVTPIYPALMAVGGIGWETFFARRDRVLQNRTVAFPVAFATAILCCALVFPLAEPVLRPTTFISYQHALHLPSTNSEKYGSGLLPAFYADRFGWQEETDQVQHVVDGLSSQDRAQAVILANNYGEAGALQFLGRNLPAVGSGHNTYWLWGTPPDATGHPGSGQVVILVEDTTSEHLRTLFNTVQRVGSIGTPYAMPYERRTGIWLLHGLKSGTLSSLWPRKKGYI